MTSDQKGLLGVGALLVLFLLYRHGKKTADGLKESPVMNAPSDQVAPQDVYTDMDTSKADAPEVISDLADPAGFVSLTGTNHEDVHNAIERENAPVVEASNPLPIEQVYDSDMTTAICGTFDLPRPDDGTGAADIQRVTPFSRSFLAVIADPAGALVDGDFDHVDPADVIE